MKPADVRLSDDVGAGANGALQPVVELRLPHLMLGSFEEHDLDVDVRSQPSTFAGQVDGLLGTATLERYDVVLDIGANTLWLRPLATPPARNGYIQPPCAPSARASPPARSSHGKADVRANWARIFDRDPAVFPRRQEPQAAFRRPPAPPPARFGS